MNSGKVKVAKISAETFSLQNSAEFFLITRLDRALHLAYSANFRMHMNMVLKLRFNLFLNHALVKAVLIFKSLVPLS